MSFSIFFRKIILKQFDNLIIVEKMYNSDEVIFMLSAIANHFKRQMDARVIEVSSIMARERNYLSEDNTKIRFLPFAICFFHPIYFTLCALRVLFFGNPSFIKGYAYLDEDFQDAMAIKCGAGWQDKRFSPFVVIRIFVELSYFIFFIKIINVVGRNTRLVITGDNAYRYGCLAKYSSFSGIPVFTNLNMNELKLNHYSNFEQFSIDHSSVEEGDLEIDLSNEEIKKKVDDYFSSRFSGQIIQHDVLAAHAKNAESFKLFRNNNPVATIFCHVLCDAPSNIPGKLHKDFKDWFLDSLEILLRNRNINICVKEHPSAFLYGEEGYIKKLCLDNGLDVSRVHFVDNVSTNEVLDNSDYVVTCSGTIGLEGLYKEKQVIVASNVFYSRPGLLHSPKSSESYSNYLSSIGTESFSDINFTNDVKISVYHLLYYYFFTLNNRQKLMDFPLPQYVKGHVHELSENDFLALNKYLRENGLFNDFDAFLERKKFKWILSQ